VQLVVGFLCGRDFFDEEVEAGGGADEDSRDYACGGGSEAGIDPFSEEEEDDDAQSELDSDSGEVCGGDFFGSVGRRSFARRIRGRPLGHDRKFKTL